MSRLAALALLATCSIVAANSAAPTLRRPNILMLAVDDLRPLFGRAYDSPQQRTTVVKTPNLDRFLECASPRQASPAFTTHSDSAARGAARGWCSETATSRLPCAAPAARPS